MIKKISATSWVAVGAIVSAFGILVASMNVGAEASPAGPAAYAGKAPAMRRLTEAQYRQAIAYIFGSEIALGGRFEPGTRSAGLNAVGAATVSMTPTGLEQYDKIARTVAAQVVGEEHRYLIPCTPKNVAEPDEACARAFFKLIGRGVYRRPLSENELTASVKIADQSARHLNDFYRGLGVSLATMLTSPSFLYVQEGTEPDPKQPGAYRLNAYAKASRLSLFLWNGMPDPELLDAAERGQLNDTRGVSKQVDRMLQSPRIEAGVRAFFTDMLAFDAFETLSKDALLFPGWSAKVTEHAQEQTLRTLVDLLVTHKGDYRDIFTTPRTFLTPALASAYRLRLDAPPGALDPWVPYEYAPDAPQAGILTHASFVALHSHPGRTSPTIRGKALRELLLCQKVPDPPGNVDFELFQKSANDPNLKTVRQRLTAHSTNPVCAGCHKLTDPMGLSLENFDTTGGFRSNENGEKIDTSGEVSGVKFGDLAGLRKMLHDDPAVPACLVNRLVSYGIGRGLTAQDTDLVKFFEAKFAAGGYQLPELLKAITTNEAFFRVSLPAASGEK